MIKAPKQEDITKILYEIDQADADGSSYVQRKLRNWGKVRMAASGPPPKASSHGRGAARRMFVCVWPTISLRTT